MNLNFLHRLSQKVVAPLINCDKNDIVMLALKNNVPLELTMSCYQDGEGHCGYVSHAQDLKVRLKQIMTIII